MVRPKISQKKSKLLQYWVYPIFAILICIIWISFNNLNLSPPYYQAPAPARLPSSENANHKKRSHENTKLPDYVLRTLNYIRKYQRAPDGYVGGRHFQNRERKLPLLSKDGESIQYKEWDVIPFKTGQNRGPERLVTGSDGSAWYTLDHYKTFQKIDE
jgi:ribonuclease T1